MTFQALIISLAFSFPSVTAYKLSFEHIHKENPKFAEYSMELEDNEIIDESAFLWKTVVTGKEFEIDAQSENEEHILDHKLLQIIDSDKVTKKRVIIVVPHWNGKENELLLGYKQNNGFNEKKIWATHSVQIMDGRIVFFVFISFGFSVILICFMLIALVKYIRFR